MQDRPDHDDWRPDPLTDALGRIKRLETQIADCVSRKEFDPVRTIAFGIVALTVAAVLTALLAVVMKGRLMP
jgi:hypothetical protein